MALRLYNTMGRKMEEFKPIVEGHVGFYGCGPTVYNYAHIGNLRAYVFLDILDKTLTLLGYDIKHVMNITDVGHLSDDGDNGEDKMKKSAAERHQSVLEVANFYTDAFMKDIDAMNIRHPDVICRATEHIDDMIELIILLSFTFIRSSLVCRNNLCDFLFDFFYIGLAFHEGFQVFNLL